MSEHYKAFISYRHKPADIAAAKEVQKRLEHFHIPSSIRKKYGIKEIGRLFRDQDELPITSDISDNIEEALKNSEWLIVVCSTDTSSSRWVAREIDEFLKTHPLQNVLTVLVNGEPGEVIPEVLFSEPVKRIGEDGTEYVEMVPREPLSSDMRKGLKEARKAEIPRLAAALIGCGYDELVQRQKQYRMKQLAIWASVLSVLTTSAAGYLTWSLTQIRKNLQEGQIRESIYLSSEAQDYLKDMDHITAAKLCLKALPSEGNDRQIVSQALRVLSQSINAYQKPSESYYCTAVYPMDTDIDHFEVSPEASYISIVDKNYEFAVFDIREKRKLSLNCMDHAHGTAFADDERLIIWGSDLIQMYDLPTESVLWEYKLADSLVILGVSAGKTKVILWNDDSVIVLSKDTGKVLLDKEIHIQKMILFFDNMPTLSEDEQYVYVMTENDGIEESDFLQFNTNTGEIVSTNTRCGYYSNIVELGSRIIAADRIRSDPNGYLDTLRVEIYDDTMHRTGLYERKTDDTLTDIREISYIDENGIQKSELAVVYGSWELYLDPVSGQFLRDINFSQKIAVPFIQTSDKGQTHLDDQGHIVMNLYEDDFIAGFAQEYPNNVQSLVNRSHDNINMRFVLTKNGRRILQYTDGLYDTGLEDLGAPDLSEYAYFGSLRSINETCVYFANDNDDWYIGFIMKDGHHLSKVQQEISWFPKAIGILKNRYLFEANYRNGEKVIIAADSEGGVEYLPLNRDDKTFIAGDQLYAVNGLSIMHIDLETMQTDEVRSGLGIRFICADPDGSHIIAAEQNKYLLIDLTDGNAEELYSFDSYDSNTICEFSKDGSIIYLIQNRQFKNLTDGSTFILPNANTEHAYMSGQVLYLIGGDNVLTIVDVRDGHVLRQTVLTGNIDPSVKWYECGDTLYLYSDDILCMLEKETGIEFASVRCLGFNPLKEQFYVNFTTEQSLKQHIGRFHRYTAKELIEKGYAFTKNAELE